MDGVLTLSVKPASTEIGGVLELLQHGATTHAETWNCGREQMLRHPMSVVRRGPLMLARSKRIGCSEAEMFSGETVWGKECTITAQNIRFWARVS